MRNCIFVSLWLQCLKCCMFSFSLRIEICCHRRRPVAASTPISPEPEPEVEWDIVEVSSEGSSVAEEEFERRGPTPEELLDTTVRYYAVWKFSSSGASYPGVHFGKERSAYEGLLKLNNGNFGGLKWRRVLCFARARATFSAEATRHGITSSAINFYAWRWQPWSGENR